MASHAARFAGPLLVSALGMMAGCGGSSPSTPDLKDFPPGSVVVEQESLVIVSPNSCAVRAVVRNTLQVLIRIVNVNYEGFKADGTHAGFATIFLSLGPGESAQKQAGFAPDQPCSSIARFERTGIETCCAERPSALSRNERLRFAARQSRLRVPRLAASL
jgi:hypothetical protein